MEEIRKIKKSIDEGETFKFASYKGGEFNALVVSLEPLVMVNTDNNERLFVKIRRDSSGYLYLSTKTDSGDLYTARLSDSYVLPSIEYKETQYSGYKCVRNITSLSYVYPNSDIRDREFEALKLYEIRKSEYLMSVNHKIDIDDSNYHTLKSKEYVKGLGPNGENQLYSEIEIHSTW